MDNSIEERAKDFALEVSSYMYCGNCDTCEKCKDYRLYVDIATLQKAIDDAELLKLKSAWEKQAQITYNDEANDQQGYHDAIEKVCEWLRARNVITKDTLIGFRKAMEEEL